MKKYSFLFLLFLVLTGTTSFAQVDRLCDTYLKNKEFLEKHPEGIISTQELEEFTREYIQRKDKGDELYIIPVVFHIIHYNGVENISKEQIENGIEWMNNDFRLAGADTSDIIPEFKSIAADTRIEFRLARLDPDGNCTDGIVRTVSDMTFSATEEIKDISPSWPRDQYLNIWVVYSIKSGAAGYSYYPGSVDNPWGEGKDGIVIKYDYVGSIEEGSYTGARTLTHEAGHYLNLAHPWGSTNDPGVGSNCDIDDDVEDTPNTIGHSSCYLYAETCGSLDNVQNFMEYSFCGKMFTLGQKDRMRAVLNTTVSGRINLWQESNLIATGVLDPEAMAICEPIADFNFSETEGCEGHIVEFSDRSYNSDVDSTWTLYWEFPGGDPSTSTESNPVVTYNSIGWYNISLTVSNSAGSDSKTLTDKIHIYNDTSGVTAPYFESFEEPGFPISPVSEHQNWTVVNRGDHNWEQTVEASVTGDFSVKVDNFNNYERAQNTLYTPPIDISEMEENIRLFVKIAYARVSSESQDKFLVYSTDDCGEGWHVEMVKSHISLVSNDDGYVVGEFIPMNSEWKEFSANMDNYVGSESIRLKIICESNKGNTLYLDDVHVTDLSPVGEINSDQPNVNVFPNPFKEEPTIFITDIREKKIRISIYSGIGALIGTGEYSLSSDSFEINISEIASLSESGIYYLKIEGSDTLIRQKIIKTD